MFVDLTVHGIAEIILGILVVEAMLLVGVVPMIREGATARLGALPMVLAGAFLVLVLRIGPDWSLDVWSACALAGALLAHLVDLGIRWRSVTGRSGVMQGVEFSKSGDARGDVPQNPVNSYGSNRVGMLPNYGGSQTPRSGR